MSFRLAIWALAFSVIMGGPAAAQARNSAIFLHPDGMGANTWAAARLLNVGPDGRLAWDELLTVAAYKGPLLDRVSASSNGGGTSHAWGVRAEAGSFGMVGGARIAASASGKPYPLMIEAKRAGKAIGIVNTASVTDAGTGTQLAVVANRRDHADIARQMLDAEPDVLLGGGEQYFLPRGVSGAHGMGVRTDGRNLIEEARAKGYRIVRTRTELAAAANAPGKILGLFAAENTFNDGSEEDMRAKGAAVFQPQAPRYDEMVDAAIKILQSAPRGFYLMAEEEATDNLGGANNASGVLEAVSGADRAIARAFDAAKANPRLTVLVASDSDCGGLQATGDDIKKGEPTPARLANGAPVDGSAGTASAPFMTAPNAQGKRLPFAIAWASDGDMSGGGVVRGVGPGTALIRGTMDSTDVYKALHAALFGAPRRR
jgi:alkaline phosphatase